MEDPQELRNLAACTRSIKMLNWESRKDWQRLYLAILNDNLRLPKMLRLLSTTDCLPCMRALDNLPRISLRLVPEASSADYYKQLLMRIQNELLLTQNALDQARNVLTESSRLTNEASKQTDEVTKSNSLLLL